MADKSKPFLSPSLCTQRNPKLPRCRTKLVSPPIPIPIPTPRTPVTLLLFMHCTHTAHPKPLSHAGVFRPDTTPEKKELSFASLCSVPTLCLPRYQVSSTDHPTPTPTPSGRRRNLERRTGPPRARAHLVSKGSDGHMGGIGVQTPSVDGCVVYLSASACRVQRHFSISDGLHCIGHHSIFLLLRTQNSSRVKRRSHTHPYTHRSVVGVAILLHMRIGTMKFMSRASFPYPSTCSC